MADRLRRHREMRDFRATPEPRGGAVQVWPSLGITKLDLVRYYEAVGERFLPHLQDRPLTMVRCPDGAEGKCFYQRHLMMGRSPGNLKTVKRERTGKGAYLYADSLEAVISAVQNGAVEFHTWGATVPDIRHPDRITMDLDPGPGIGWPVLLGPSSSSPTWPRRAARAGSSSTTRVLRSVFSSASSQASGVETGRLERLGVDPWADYAKGRRKITRKMLDALS